MWVLVPDSLGSNLCPTSDQCEASGTFYTVLCLSIPTYAVEVISGPTQSELHTDAHKTKYLAEVVSRNATSTLSTRPIKVRTHSCPSRTCGLEAHSTVIEQGLRERSDPSVTDV